MILLIAWGSLISEGQKRGLAFNTVKGWKPGGPVFPLEFSRISRTRDGALTLVIHPGGAGNSTYIAESSGSSLEAACQNLAQVEGISSDLIPRYIGYMNLETNACHSNVLPHDEMATRIQTCVSESIHAVLWTDLPGNFNAQVGKPFTTDNAVEYLHNLPEQGATQARQYFQICPADIVTPLRQRVNGDHWLKT